jgi:hypothetical protein
MPGPVVRVEGAAQLSKAFRAAGGTVRELSGAYREVARSLVPPAQRAAPRRSGKLAASTRGLGQRTRAILAAGSARVPYAGPIHFGNPSAKTYPARIANPKRSTGTLGVIRPNPWLYRTADHRRAEVVEVFDDHVGATLRKYGLSSPLG